MRRLFKLLLFIACITVASCDSDEPQADYYVRYTAIGDADKMMTMYLKNEKNEDMVLQAESPDGRLCQTVGPVKKGFKAEMAVSYMVGGAVKQLTIEVAEGAGQFVSKAAGSNYYTLSYVIE